ncbi:hypothetical protein [Mycolicibacterium sp. 624]|uniref:hypothetical protein n=1 Tax=Mycolicibacterium sp. 624 TaxID=3156314 RepID=UPI0033931941
MRTSIKAVISTAIAVGGALAAAGPAVAAPHEAGSAADTIVSLQESGYTVIVNKVGSAALEDCTVRAIRPGRKITEMRSDIRDRTVEKVVYTTVYLDAECQ